MNHGYKVYVDGVYACGISGNYLGEVIAETLHYARQYSDDGAVTIKGTNGKVVKVSALIHLLESTEGGGT